MVYAFFIGRVGYLYMQRIWRHGYQLAGHGCQTEVVECEVGESSRFLLEVALSADTKKQEWV